LSEIDDALAGPFSLLEHAPVAFAVTRGPTHTLLYANAAFRTIPGTVQAPTSGCLIVDIFAAAVASRLTSLLDRAMRGSSALRDQFIGSLDAESGPWCCTVWPALRDSTATWVIELRVTTHSDATLSLQREVAERLLLSALHENEAAEDAEASRQRAAFLESAGRHLDESLDTDVTEEAVAGLTLPSLAEWCIVDLLKADDTMHRLTIVHPDPATRPLVSHLQNCWSPESGDPFGLPAVLRNPQPLLIADNVDAALASAAHNSENLRVLRELRIGALLTVPLIREKKVIGAITFVGGEGDRAFTDQDVELAEGLAARSALALEKARQYGEALLLKDKAEAAAKAATKFLGTVSHELRTPLTTIFGYVELIAGGIYGPITEAQRVALNHITKSQRTLLYLIEELLDFMRMGSGRVFHAAVAVSLGEAVTAAVEVLQLLIAKKSLTCNIVVEADASFASADPDILAESGAIFASADPDSLHQILVNLISNAIKFTSEGGEITIICKETQDSVTVTVSDNGRGIPPDKLDLIFEPFSLAYDDDASEHGGIGLGLPISRELARAMHGDINVESTLGKGSTFTLTLPSHPKET